MTLGEKQRLFARLVGLLLERIYAEGYECAIAWAYRPREVSAYYRDQGKGIRSSLHGDKLAIDLDLFKNGIYLPRTEDHKRFGEYWTSLNPLCSWGGDFGDGNHYSVTHDGRR